MPDKAWLERHKKVQTYVPEELYELFLNWKQERGIKSSSRALQMILREFFGLPEGLEQVSEALPLISRLDDLEARIAAIEKRLEGDSRVQGELPGLSDFFQSAHERHYGNR